jgi:AcrR family transcriptional regulator
MRVMPKGQRVKLKREISKERVLEVAARLFREKGYLATGTREIAEAANMKSGSLYYHYPSKEALLSAVMTLAIEKLTDAVRQAIADTPASEGMRGRLRNAIRAHLKVIHEHVDMMIASRQSVNLLPEESRDAHIRLRENYAQVWRELLESGKASGDVAQDADVVLIEMFLLGALNWTSEWFDPARLSFDRLSQGLMDLVLNGARGPDGLVTRPVRAAVR